MVMTDEELKELRLKMSLPHIAAARRKIEGAPEGNLKCWRCGEMNASRNRQQTAYVDDESNFAVFCPTCQDETDKYWQEMWTDYYNSVL